MTNEMTSQMTSQADLERGYRRLLAWYPRRFRRENGPEILAVLMAGAPDGQRRPGLAERGDLIRSGLRMRLRPGAPRPARTVRAAVGLMRVGAAIAIVNLINSVYMVIVLSTIDDNKIHHMRLFEVSGTLQVPRQDWVGVAVSIAGNLAVIALWRWMARAARQRRSWARIAATALFGLATLEVGLGLAIPSSITLTSNLGGWPVAAVTWPIGAAAVGLLWCRASTAFFKPQELASVFPSDLALPGGDSTPTDRRSR
jgi:hypothetical protein